MITRPVLRYHGGKFRLAPWIISQFPNHRIYVEPFCGAASVLMRKPRSYAEIINDKWGIVVNIFRVLRDPEQAAELERRIRLTPFARDEFDLCDNNPIDDLIEQVRRTIFRSFAGFGSASANGKYSTGFRANSNRSGTTPAHDWMHYPDNIKYFTERLAGVVIENREAEEIIKQHDGEKTLFYIDPPYPQETRNMQRGKAVYKCEMNTDDHQQLAELLHKIQGKVVISGYPCKLYDEELYQDWRRIERKAFADGARPRIEVLWMNFNDYNQGTFL